MSPRDRIKRAALVAARAGGCVCKPDITLIGEDPLFKATLEHDDHCPLAHVSTARPSGPIVLVSDAWGRDEL